MLHLLGFPKITTKWTRILGTHTDRYVYGSIANYIPSFYAQNSDLSKLVGTPEMKILGGREARLATGSSERRNHSLPRNQFPCQSPASER